MRVAAGSRNGAGSRGGIEKPLEMSRQGLRFGRNRREVLIREADLVGDIAEFVV